MASSLADRILNLLARAVVKAAKDDKKLQELQVAVLGGDDVLDDVEHWQTYGFTSVPREGAEALIGCVSGHRDHTVVLCVGDRRYRLRNLESGEVAVYNDSGAKIVFKASGDIEVTPKSGQKLKLSGDFEIDGSVSVTGDVDSDGTVTGAVDVNGGGKSLKNHTHPYTDVSDGGTADNDTGSPN